MTEVRKPEGAAFAFRRDAHDDMPAVIRVDGAGDETLLFQCRQNRRNAAWTVAGRIGELAGRALPFDGEYAHNRRFTAMDTIHVFHHGRFAIGHDFVHSLECVIFECHPVSFLALTRVSLH